MNLCWLAPDARVEALVLVAAVAAAGSIGCGPAGQPLAPVAGLVTLDGEPLAGARVVFEPQSTGSPRLLPSFGRTDEEGRFTLAMRDGSRGAAIAEHRVRISTEVREPDPSSLAGVVVVAKETLPKRYNDRSELVREITAEGDTACDFNLSSGR